MNQKKESHIPVLRDEVIDALAIKQDGLYIDGTFGRGGHSREILGKLGQSGRLWGVDQDPQAVEFAQHLFPGDDRFKIFHSSFANMLSVAQQHKIVGHVNGVMLDLGVSSPQLDEAERGFSFDRDGPLDMRMNPTTGISAAEWVATTEFNEMVKVLKVYGEERFAKRIVTAIIEQREQQPIVTTKQLADIVSVAVPVKEKHKHPATRTFQAIRIEVNQELAILENALEGFIEMLAPGGRLAVISFHSLEDRIVKQYFRRLTKAPPIPKGMPMAPTEFIQKVSLVGKAIKPSIEEIERNRRSRSAVLRVVEKK